VRHGVTPRGTILVSGGWNGAPFDISPDRRFAYDGRLFEVGEGCVEPTPQSLGREVARLARSLERIIASDREKLSSPVFSALPGLKPVDWSRIENARAQYFNVVIDALSQRVQTARAEGWPGDIMTLVEEAPTRLHEKRLLMEAARGLTDLHRLDPAREQIEALLEIAPEDLEGRVQLAMVLNRLDRSREAEILLRDVASEAPTDIGMLSALGAVYTDLWTNQWEHLPELEQRQRAALRGYALAARATRYYQEAFLANLNAYSVGVDALGLIHLCTHLGKASGEDLSVATRGDRGFADALRLALQSALARDRARPIEPIEEVWAEAAKGQLDLLCGDGKRARHQYRKAVGLTDCSVFMAESMREQLRRYDLLDFRHDLVAPIIADLEYEIEKRQPKRYEMVVVFSGHRTDAPTRVPRRFPESAANAARQAIHDRLVDWGVRPGVAALGICGGARGGDILFAETCLELGADVRLLMTLPEAEFLAKCVRNPGSDWVDRYFALKGSGSCKALFQHERLGSAARDQDRHYHYYRNNLWCLNSARAEVDAAHLYVLTLWDEDRNEEGGEGIADFVARARRYASRYENINPATLGVATTAEPSVSISGI